MSNKYRKQFADAQGALIEYTGAGILFAEFNGVPTASLAGFAKGCVAIDRSNGEVYENTGSTTSATWSKFLRDGGTISSGTITTLTTTTLNPTGIVRASQTYQVGRGGTAKAGTTAGWTVNAGNNIGTIATVAASQSAATLVMAMPNLHVGDTITGFSVYASINSAGGAVTLDANLRQLVVAAGATATDSSIGSITQISVSAATAATATKSGLSTVVTAGVNYYLLLTATTAGSTTIELDQVEVTVTSA